MNRCNNDHFNHQNALFATMPMDTGVVDHTRLKQYMLEPPDIHNKHYAGNMYFDSSASYSPSIQNYNNYNNIVPSMHNSVDTAAEYANVPSINDFIPHYNVTDYPALDPTSSNQSVICSTFNTDLSSNGTAEYHPSSLSSSLPSFYDTSALSINNQSFITTNHHPRGNHLLNSLMQHDPNLSADSLLLSQTGTTSQNNSVLTSNVSHTSVIRETNSLLSQSTPSSSLPVDVLVAANSNYADIVSAANSYISSPIFGAECGIQQSKMDCDPFSPSISSNVSSVPSIELSDKTSFIPGSVDSGVVVNGSISSPFSVPESSKNGEYCNISDSSFISPSAQRTGSERSIETTPRSESISSETCSPQVTDQAAILPAPLEQPNNNLVTITKVKEDKPHSGKGRKRRNELKKEKSKHKKQPLIIKPTYQSQISPDENGIKLKISISTAPPISVKRRGKHKKSSIEYDEPQEQSGWGDALPDLVLYQIFRTCVETEGCIPFLPRMSRVCKLWRRVAIEPSLWYHIDLSARWTSKNPVVNDHNFRWLCENRLCKVRDLNLGGWKFSNIPGIIEKIVRCCNELQGISLTGWEGLTVDNIHYLVSHCTKLERVDLTGISNNQSSYNKSGVSTASLLFLTEELGSRLTHLVLSDNKLGGILQIISSIAANCPNLQLLDLSNIRTVASTGQLNIEQLQAGCPKLRILRITNSQLCLMAVSAKEEADSPGFPLLEELSVACVSNSLTSITQPYVDDCSIQRILKTSTKLKLLDTRGCYRVTDVSLLRVPSWDLTHLFLSGSYVTRTADSGLEFIAQKWSHSLVEVDLAWSSSRHSVDQAVLNLAEQGANSPLRVLDLSGSSVSLGPVKRVTLNCPLLTSLNLSSCRALPRGMKKQYTGSLLADLKASFTKPSNDDAVLLAENVESS